MLRGAVGAMRTTSKASLGMHLDIKGRGANSMYRLRSFGQWRSGTGHTKIPLLDELLLGMRTDFIPQRFHFGRKWTVTIPSWEKWLQKQSLPGNGDVWYTDGSKSEEMFGMGYYSRKDGKGTVFQTKFMALLGCAHMLDELQAVGRDVNICSDSQADLMALAAPATRSRGLRRHQQRQGGPQQI